MVLFDEKTRPKPSKIAEILAKSQIGACQGNLMILGRKETSIDREKELGRWKVIEAELRSRGLPVLGKLQVTRNRA